MIRARDIEPLRLQDQIGVQDLREALAGRVRWGGARLRGLYGVRARESITALRSACLAPIRRQIATLRAVRLALLLLQDDSE